MQGDLHGVRGCEGKTHDQEDVVEDVDQCKNVHLDVVFPVGRGIECGDVKQRRCRRQAEVDVRDKVEDVVVVEKTVSVDFRVEGAAYDGEDKETQKGDGYGHSDETFWEVVDPQTANRPAEK